jgi:Sodium/hydrogen exchanger family
MPMLLSFVLTMHAVSNAVLHEAGLIAVTVFGVALANMNIAGLAELTRFKETLVVMIVSALFIVLGSDLEGEVLARLSVPLLMVTAAIVFLVRPAAIMLATIGSGMTWKERVLVSWIGPRGIVAAAVAGLAALKLPAEAYPTSELLQPAIFAVIAATVLLHGFTLRPLARALGLVSTERPSIAIVGASPWSTDLALALHQLGVPVTMIDTHKGALKDSRRAGIHGLQIEVLAEKGDEALHQKPNDYVIAATPDEIYNALICSNLAPEIGRERVFQIAAGGGRLMDDRRGLSRDMRGKIWADLALDYQTLEERHEAGWRFRPLHLDGKAGPDGLPRSDAMVPAIIVHADGTLSPISPEGTGGPKVSPGDTVIGYTAPQASAASADGKILARG